MKRSLFNEDLSLHGMVCDPLACIALGVTDGVAWQRDWESGSYVEEDHQVADLQQVNIGRSTTKVTSQD